MLKIYLALIFLSTNSFAQMRMDFYSLEMARTAALNISYNALMKAPFSKQEVIENIYQKISEVKFNTPDFGHDFTTCTPQTLAYVEMYKDAYTINLCHLSLIGSIDKLAQTIIHESAHLIGFEKECDASKIELLVYKLGQRPLNYRNNYLNNCRLNESLRGLLE